MYHLQKYSFPGFSKAFFPARVFCVLSTPKMIHKISHTSRFYVIFLFLRQYNFLDIFHLKNVVETCYTIYFHNF